MQQRLGHPRHKTLGLALVLFLGILGTLRSAEPTPNVPPDHPARMKAGLKLFKDHVRPLLTKHCLECHGGKSTKADFDLATRKGLMDSGTVGEDAESSYLFSLITHAEEPHMPFKSPKLSAEAVAHVRKWIDLGAPYDAPLKTKSPDETPLAMQVTAEDRAFWSFQPLSHPVVPTVQNAAWGQTAIDRFVLAKLEARGLHPNESTDKRRLIRRATFDLIGLPPTPEEVEAFVNNPDPLAYEQLIDRLLASPHYGERWARHWLDVARFGESHGYEQDYDRAHAYPYRDFLIQALNADLPFDQFVHWQLAGDELAPDNPLALAATGFLGGGAFPTQLTEAEFESARYDELDDMTATTGVAFLGLSVGCARCHDHKFDPIPARDYSRLAATFTTTIRSEIELAFPPNQTPIKVQVSSEGFPPVKHHADDRGFPHFYPQTFHLSRGDVHQKLDVAEAGFLQVLTDEEATPADWRIAPPTDWKRTSFRRAALAQWMTDPERGAGHLVARVMVNRLWQHHFGMGIVATPNDFGFQGERPTHPELLDWLSQSLIDQKWRLKPLHKLIMTSSVYRQSSDFDETRAQKDRENVLHWRRTPQRLEAEAIRDSMLAIAEQLDRRMFGAGTLDQSMQRRGVYFFIKRSQLIPMMMLFDWPEHLVSIGRRSVTTTAPQALVFMNSPLGRRSAEGFAERLLNDEKTTAAKSPIEPLIARGFVVALGRAATESELTAMTKFYRQQVAIYQQHKSPQPERLALIDTCQALMSLNEFIYVD